MATVEEFAAVTRRVIARDGFEGYLPTAMYPDRGHVVVLEGAPETADLETLAVTWAARGAVADEEFLVAFKVGSMRFKVVRSYRGRREEGLFEVSGDDV